MPILPSPLRETRYPISCSARSLLHCLCCALPVNPSAGSTQPSVVSINHDRDFPIAEGITCVTSSASAQVCGAILNDKIHANPREDIRMNSFPAIPFVKASACGNDFLVIDGSNAPADLA